MNVPVLTLQDVQKRFPAFHLGPVSLALAPGRVHGLLGPNGAGKTTLLNLITLQARLTSGAMWFGDRPIRWGEAWWKSRFAYVRETPSFYPELTVRQTLQLASRIYGQWDATMAARMSARLGLEEGQRVGDLSKGTRVKLGVAAALAQRADVLLLDEPTAGVDPDAREELYGILRELRQTRPELCVVLSSHIFQDLEALADDVLILRDGRIAHRVTGDQLHGGRLADVYRATAQERRETA